MNKPKRKTPYQMLMEDAQRFARDVKYPRQYEMFFLPKSNLSAGYNLDDVYERVQAASQLGYDVMLKATENGIKIMYVEKRPETPLGWRG